MSEARVPCRTPAEGRDGVTNVPQWKFDLLYDAIRTALAGGDIKQTELKECVRPHIAPADLDRLGSLGWHVTTVRLEMEVRGDVVRKSERPVVIGWRETP